MIGCCGIYCPACPFYRDIPELAKKLKEEIKKEKFGKVAVPFEWVGDYREFKKWLNFLARAKCRGCEAGGGGWNIRNLERVREVGYERLLKEKEEELKEGFFTGKVIKGIKRKRG